MPSQKISNQKLYSLQAGRAIAALLVVFYHSTQQLHHLYGVSFLGNSFNLGFSGVNFFFVLSGFIIAFTAYEDIGHPEKAKIFAKRRFLRIYPIYWVYLTSVIIIFFVSHQSQGKGYYSLENILRCYLLLFENQHIVTTSWTLSYEVFFYLSFLLLILWKKTAKYIVGGFILLTVFCYAELLITGKTFFIKDSLMDKMFRSHNLEFLFGVLAYKFWDKISLNQAKLMIGIGILSFLAALLCIPTHLEEPFRANGLFTLIFGVPAFMIVISLVKLESYLNFKTPNILARIGDASYTLYLVHCIFLTMCHVIIIDKLHFILINYTITYLLFIVGSIVISLGLYKWIEKPLMKKLGRFMDGTTKPIAA